MYGCWESIPYSVCVCVCVCVCTSRVFLCVCLYTCCVCEHVCRYTEEGASPETAVTMDVTFGQPYQLQIFLIESCCVRSPFRFVLLFRIVLLLWCVGVVCVVACFCLVLCVWCSGVVDVEVKHRMFRDVCSVVDCDH